MIDNFFDFAFDRQRSTGCDVVIDSGVIVELEVFVEFVFEFLKFPCYSDYEMFILMFKLTKISSSANLILKF